MGLLERLRDEGRLSKKPKTDSVGRVLLPTDVCGVGTQLALGVPPSPKPSAIPLAPHQRVGLPSGWTVRGVIAKPNPDGTLALTVKVTDSEGGKWYRHGAVTDLLSIGAVIHRWVEGGYWSPDRQ